MVKRQGQHLLTIADTKGEQRNIIERNLFSNKCTEGLWKGKFVNTDLNRDLPDTGNAQEYCVVRLKQGYRCFAETWIIIDEP